VDSSRRCTRSSCERPAVATLTYSYQDSTVVIGPMSMYAEPHTYDLCSQHADSVNPPRGWEVMRLDYAPAAETSTGRDDLLALADAVQREVPEPAAPAPSMRENRERIAPPEGEAPISRGHLRMLKD